MIKRSLMIAVAALAIVVAGMLLMSSGPRNGSAQLAAIHSVINTARGDVIDTRALIQALTSGKVAAAGLDVLPDEPMMREEAELICSIFCDQYDLRNLVANHVLLRMRNVIVTPHSAFNTREAVSRIVRTTVDNIRAFLNGAPRNVVAGPR